MRFPNPYWSNKLKIGTLQRWLIVHSILYYELNESVVSDKMFDDNAKQLVSMQKEDKASAKCSQYWYVFHDFDGSTGFYLYDNLRQQDKEYLLQIANHVLYLHKQNMKRR